MPMRAVLSIIHVNTWYFRRCMARLSKTPLKIPYANSRSAPSNSLKSLALRRYSYLSQNNFVSVAHSAKTRTPSDDPRVSDGVNSIGECRLR